MSENGAAAPNGANEFVFTQEQLKAFKTKGENGIFSHRGVEKLLIALSKEIEKSIDGLYESVGVTKGDKKGLSAKNQSVLAKVERLAILKTRVAAVSELFNSAKIGSKIGDLDDLGFEDHEVENKYLTHLFDDLLDYKLETQKFIDDVSPIEMTGDFRDTLKDRYGNKLDIKSKLELIGKKFRAYADILRGFHKTMGLSKYTCDEDNFKSDLIEYKNLLGDGKSLEDLKLKNDLFDKLAEDYFSKKYSIDLSAARLVGGEEGRKKELEKLKKNEKTEDLAKYVQDKINDFKNSLESKQEIEKKLSDLEAEYNIYKSTHRHRDDDFDSIRNEKFQIQTEYNQYKVGHEYSNEAYDSLSNSYNNLQFDYNSLNADYWTVKNDRDILSAEKESLENKNILLENTNNALSSKVDLLSNQINALNAENKDETITNLNSQINDLNSQISNLNNQVGSLTIEKNDTENKLNNLQTEYDSYKNNHSHTDDDYQNIYDSSQNISNENVSQRNKIDELENKIHTLENEKNILSSAKQSLQDQVDAFKNENKDDTIKNLTDQITNLNDRINSLSDEKNNLEADKKNAQDEATKLKSDLENTKNSLSAKENDITGKDKEIKDLKDQIETLKNTNLDNGAQKTLDLYKKQLEVLIKAKTDSEKSLNDKIQTLTGNNNKLDGDLKKANEKINDLTKQKNKAETDKNNIETKLNKVKKDYDALKNSSNIDEQLKNQLENLANENDSLIDHKNKAEADLKEKNDKIAELEKNLKSANDQLEAQKKLNNIIGKGNLAEQIENLTKEIAQKQGLINEKDQEIQKLKAEASGGKPPEFEFNDIEKLNKIVKELEDKNKNLEEENKKLKSEQEQKEKQNPDQIVSDFSKSAPSKAGNITLSVVGGVGVFGGVATITASFLLKAGVVLSGLGLGFPVAIIILGGTGFAFGIYNLKKTGDMKNMYVVGPLKKIDDLEKTKAPKENKARSNNNKEKE